jgi:hypothetical protein
MRESDVKNRNIGIQFLSLLQGLTAIRGLAANHPFRPRLQHSPQPTTHNIEVVRY